MKPVRVKSVNPYSPAAVNQHKLDILAAIAAVLTVLAAIIGLYIAWRSLKTNAPGDIVVI